jgi:hypothetical protein
VGADTRRPDVTDNYDVIGPVVSDVIILAVIDAISDADHVIIGDAVLDAVSDGDFDDICDDNQLEVLNAIVEAMNDDIHALISRAVIRSMSATNLATLNEDTLVTIGIAALVAIVDINLDIIKDARDSPKET